MSLRHEDWKELFLRSSRLGSFFLPGNGSNRARTRKTSCRKHSCASGARQHSIQNRALLFATVRSISLDLLRRDARRARREATAALETRAIGRAAISTDETNHNAPSRLRWTASGRTTRGRGHEDLERAHLRGNRDRARHFAKHGRFALSLCPKELKKNLLPQ